MWVCDGDYGGWGPKKFWVSVGFGSSSILLFFEARVMVSRIADVRCGIEDRLQEKGYRNQFYRICLTLLTSKSVPPSSTVLGDSVTSNPQSCWSLSSESSKMTVYAARPQHTVNARPPHFLQPIPTANLLHHRLWRLPRQSLLPVLICNEALALSRPWLNHSLKRLLVSQIQSHQLSKLWIYRRANVSLYRWSRPLSMQQIRRAAGKRVRIANVVQLQLRRWMLTILLLIADSTDPAIVAAI